MSSCLTYGARHQCLGRRGVALDWVGALEGRRRLPNHRGRIAVALRRSTQEKEGAARSPCSLPLKAESERFPSMSPNASTPCRGAKRRSELDRAATHGYPIRSQSMRGVARRRHGRRLASLSPCVAAKHATVVLRADPAEQVRSLWTESRKRSSTSNACSWSHASSSSPGTPRLPVFDQEVEKRRALVAVKPAAVLVFVVADRRDDREDDAYCSAEVGPLGEQDAADDGEHERDERKRCSFAVHTGTLPAGAVPSYQDTMCEPRHLQARVNEDAWRYKARSVGEALFEQLVVRAAHG